MNNEERDRFVESWGSLGILWGINRSMARIHAYLLTSDEPVDADTISEALQISRGNVSMCLKELRAWGVAERVHHAGDRRDFYRAEPDPWKMIYRIAAGRKTREFDPALYALRHLLAETDVDANQNVHERLSELEELLSLFDRFAAKMLENEAKSKTMLNFFRGLALK